MVSELLVRFVLIFAAVIALICAIVSARYARKKRLAREEKAKQQEQVSEIISAD